MKTQNEGIPTAGYVKVIGTFERTDLKYKIQNIIIEVDNEIADYLYKAKNINIGFDRVYVNESFHVMRCFKCGQFGHKKTTCQNDEACSKCMGKHKTSEC